MDSDVPKYRKRGGKHKPFTIIREQQERIDRLTAKIAELKAADDLCNAAKTLSDLDHATVKWEALYGALFAELEGK